MIQIDNVLTKLNELCNCEEYNDASLHRLLNYLIKKKRLAIVVFDYKTYTEEYSLILKQQQALVIKEQNYEKALIIQDRRNECEIIQYFKEKYSLEESLFCIQNQTIIYFHTGKAKNDEPIFILIDREFLNPYRYILSFI